MKRHDWKLLQREWMEANHRTLKDFSEAVKIPYDTVRKQAAKRKWHTKSLEQAQIIEDRAAKKFTESVSDRIAKARLRHVNIGVMLQQKGVENFRRATELDASQSVSAIRTGVEIERKGLGLDEHPGGSTNIQNNTIIGEIQQLAISDAGVREALTESLRRKLGA